MNTLRVLGLLLSLSWPLAGAASELWQGMQAFERGDYSEAMRIWQPLAEQDNGVAQYMLGELYEQGLGVAANRKVSRQWFRRAVENGVSKAAYALGEGYARDYLDFGRQYQSALAVKARDAALMWFARARDMGDERAAARYQELTENSVTARPQDEFNGWWLLGLGVAVVVLVLSFLVVLRGRPRKPVSMSAGEIDALRRYERNYNGAMAGQSDAQFRLAQQYLAGDGAQQDAEQAVQWLRKAADLNDASAQFALGECYSQGVGVLREHGRAVDWYRRAAEQGNPDAQMELAMKYLRGEGVPEDFQQVTSWLSKAAEQGHVEAQAQLGVLLRDGAGAALATTQAFDTISFKPGEGIPEDKQRALYWLLLAARQGHTEAQTNLGDMYLHGEGVAADRQAARRWYQQAADGGNDFAIAKLKRLDAQ